MCTHLTSLIHHHRFTLLNWLLLPSVVSFLGHYQFITPSHHVTTQTPSTTMSTRLLTTKILDHHNNYHMPCRVWFWEVPSLLTMSDAKSSKGLKNEEVEKGTYGTVVELPYVPVYNEEADSNAKELRSSFPTRPRRPLPRLPTALTRSCS